MWLPHVSIMWIIYWLCSANHLQGPMMVLTAAAVSLPRHICVGGGSRSAAVVLHPPALSAPVSPGSPGPMSCPATAAHTLASSPTSVRCVRRSSPAAITCPNTQRSTAAPDPTGLSELLCDAQLAPKTCPASILAPSAGAPELRTLRDPVSTLRMKFESRLLHLQRCFLLLFPPCRSCVISMLSEEPPQENVRFPGLPAPSC